MDFTYVRRSFRISIGIECFTVLNSTFSTSPISLYHNVLKSLTGNKKKHKILREMHEKMLLRFAFFVHFRHFILL